MEPFPVRPLPTLRRPDSGSRREAIKKAISPPPESVDSAARATIPGMSPQDPLRKPRRSTVACLAIVVVLLVSACGAATPSVGPSAVASPSPAPSTATTTSPSASASGVAPSASSAANTDPIYDAVQSQVVAIRGLKPVRPVPRQIINATELRTMITQQFDEATPPAYLAANERLYKALGLIPSTSNLRDLSLDLLSGGVAAFYRDDEGKLYVVSKTGQPGATERFYFAHEYDHALQDQNSTIFKDQDKVLDQSDRLIARQAIYEGDATLLMTQWAAANLKPAELADLIATSGDPEAAAVLARMPAILRETLTFPYTTGFAYVQGVLADGGWPAVNAYFKAMPASTEQILHPEKYTAGEAPVAVTLPADLATRLGTGWSVPLLDTFGEYQMGLWLRESGVAKAAATAAAAGWGGDRLAVMQGPDGAWAVALQTVWDTAADAAEFDVAATTALAKAGGVGRVLPGVDGKTRWVVVADDAGTLGQVANVLELAG